MCVCKCPPVRVVNAFSQMLRGNMFSTFAAGKSTNFEECILHLRLQFNSLPICVFGMKVRLSAMSVFVNAVSQMLRGNLFSAFAVGKSS